MLQRLTLPARKACRLSPAVSESPMHAMRTTEDGPPSQADTGDNCDAATSGGIVMTIGTRRAVTVTVGGVASQSHSSHAARTARRPPSPTDAAGGSARRRKKKVDRCGRTERYDLRTKRQFFYRSYADPWVPSLVSVPRRVSPACDGPLRSSRVSPGSPWSMDACMWSHLALEVVVLLITVPER